MKTGFLTSKRMVSVFLCLAAWLLAGCAGTRANARAGASDRPTPLALRDTPTIEESLGRTQLPADDLTPSNEPVQPTSSPTPAFSPTPQGASEIAATPLSLPATPTLASLATQPAQTEPPLPSPSPKPRPSPAPDAWKTWPVVPTISQTARDIYLRGQALGRDPHHFSKIGDCQNITTYFLSHFEDPTLYRLGDYASLQPAIDWFMGSFARESLAVKGGLNVAAVLSPLRANPAYCGQGENPLACEYRLYNPSFAIISMEEAWSGEPDKYGKYMRQVIEYTIDQGIVPVIATKADDLEGGDRINAIIAELAWEYDIPMWNFWAAAQPLPDHGLIEDGFHLTHGNNFFFDVPANQHSGYTMRNLTALQVIDAVWRGLTAP
jgi:hypothetical protein